MKLRITRNYTPVMDREKGVSYADVRDDSCLYLWLRGIRFTSVDSEVGLDEMPDALRRIVGSTMDTDDCRCASFGDRVTWNKDDGGVPSPLTEEAIHEHTLRIRAIELAQAGNMTASPTRDVILDASRILEYLKGRDR